MNTLSRLLLAAAFISTSAFAAETHPLSVIQFNTWGVPHVVWDTFRYQDAMTQIEIMNPDVVLLEEVFSAKGRRAYHSDAYPYEAYGPHAFPKIVSSGLKILSKFPIERREILVYGSCHAMDCLSRKGALLVVLKLADGKKLNVIATHLNTPEDGKSAGQLAQITQLAEFIKAKAEKGAPILIGGDFNFEYDEAPYASLITQLYHTEFAISDLWTKTQPPEAEGYTQDAFVDGYTMDYSKKTHSLPMKKRIDYQFSNLTPVSSKVIFNEAPFYSDHFGLYGQYTY